ncbi:hypothetical protein TNCV_2540991 [Trichonephila clavipes]|nr:hypothetical protein TNCV_2540991 [Trichonephila clavipes]
MVLIPGITKSINLRVQAVFVVSRVRYQRTLKTRRVLRLVHVKFIETETTLVGRNWKLEDEVPVLVSSSSLDLGLKLRGP